MKCYLFLTFAIGGSYPHPKGCVLATAYLSIEYPVYNRSGSFSVARKRRIPSRGVSLPTSYQLSST